VKPCIYPLCDCSKSDVQEHGCGLSVKLERQVRDLSLVLLGMLIVALPLLGVLAHRGLL